MTKFTISQISDNDDANADIAVQSKSSGRANWVSEHLDTANIESKSFPSGKRSGFFSRLMAWVAKGSEKASKSGMLCSS